MPQPADPLAAAVLIAEALAARQISYAIGGALAYGLWGVPRATIDVDVNVFVDDDQLGRVFDALEELGITVHREQALAENGQRGQFVVQFGPYRLDIFTPSIGFSWEAEKTRVQQTIDGKTVWFLSAEAIAVFKLLFFRAKDIVDLQRLLAVQRDRMDSGYVRRHVAEMMGEDDERIARWDELVAEHAGVSQEEA